MIPKASIFHIGPQKTGTTWLYHCLKEHPQVATSVIDSIHYFDMGYHRGDKWFLDQFALESSDQKLFDPTPSYFRDKIAPKRIFNYNPDAIIMFTARNPIERAFSHYWHEKKKDRFNFTFDEVLKNYDLYANWIEPGMYALHLKQWLKFFPEEQIKVLHFEDLENDPSQFLNEVLEFCELDTNFTPSVLNKKLNVARKFRPNYYHRFRNKLSSFGYGAKYMIKPLDIIFTKNTKESLKDVQYEVKHELLKIYNEDIAQFEELTKRDLSHWKKVNE